MRWIRSSETALVAAAIALLASFAPACSDSLAPPIAAAHPDDATPRRGGTLRLATFADVHSLDPAGVNDGAGRPALEAIYAGLVDFDDRGALVPELAARWEIADEGRTVRFFLREGALFHDGTEVTADDVKRSAQRALGRDALHPFRSLFSAIEGFDAFTSGKALALDGIVVEGRYVVVFRLREPDATFLAKLAMHVLRPVCKSAGERYTDGWPACGAGPFKALPGALQPGVGLRLVRHEAYFRAGLPYLDAVEWSFGMNALTQRTRFEMGRLDVARELNAGDAMRFLNDPRWRALTAHEPSLIVNGEAMNVEMPPFDNVEVRRAVASALDRDHFRLLNPARMEPATYAIPPAVLGDDASREGQRYDYGAALEHMKRAGYTYDPATKRGGYTKPIVYTAYSQGLGENTAQVVQQELAKIGLTLQIRLLSPSAWATVTASRGQSAIAPRNNSEDYPDALSYLELFGGEATEGDTSASGTFWKSGPYDALLARARRELDPAKRAALYRDANAIVCDEAPWAFTSLYHYFVVRQPYVRAYHPHPVWLQDVRFVWRDRDADKLASILGARL